MGIAGKMKSLFKTQENYFADNLLLEKNGKVVKNVNVKYNVGRNRKWPGHIVADNLKITDYDLFCLLYKLNNSHTRIVEVIVKKTLFGKIVFKAASGQSLL